MQHGGKTTIIKIYRCGYCYNNLHRIYKNMPKETIQFPATAILFSHQNNLYLIDTGYSKRVFEYGLKSKIYHKLNPIVYEDSNSLKNQLEADGISNLDIKGIILTHLHPDHIGGLKDFPNSQIIMSEKSYALLVRPKLLDLVFKNLVPVDWMNRLRIIEEKEDDLFQDGTIEVIDLPGHTKDQIGLYFKELKFLYAADATWGIKFIDNQLKFIPKLLQRDYKHFNQTILKLKEYMSNGIKVMVSHEQVDDK